MLTRFHKILIGVLAVQVLLAVLVLTRGDGNTVKKEHPLFAGFDAAKVTHLQVSGPPGEAKPDAKPADAKAVDLVKHDASWVLASGYDYPVDAGKVTDALAPVAKLTAGDPIATQASRHKQLHVADTDFERKLVMTVGGKDVTLYIGNSAGVRRTAVRIGGDDNVYAVTGISASLLGAEPRAWVDTGYVKVPTDEVAKVTIVGAAGAPVELSKTSAPPAGAGSGSAPAVAKPAEGAEEPPAPAEHWTATLGGAAITLDKGETLDESVISRLIGAVTLIDLTAPADPKRDASKPTATITIERKPAKDATAPVTPTVVDIIADGASYWVHDRSSPRAVLVDKARLDDVVNANRDKLVKKPAPIGKDAGAVKPDGALPGLPPGMNIPGMDVVPGAGPDGN